jgi:hypothetical protein
MKARASSMGKFAGFYACPVCNATSDQPGSCEQHDEAVEMDAIFMRTAPDGQPEGNLTSVLDPPVYEGGGSNA